MIGRTVLVAAAILALAGSAPSAAKDEAGAKKIADDLWLASIAARDCPDTSLNKDMLLFWSKTLISDFDGDKDIAADLVQTTKGTRLAHRRGRRVETGADAVLRGYVDRLQRERNRAGQFDPSRAVSPHPCPSPERERGLGAAVHEETAGGAEPFFVLLAGGGKVGGGAFDRRLVFHVGGEQPMGGGLGNQALAQRVEARERELVDIRPRPTIVGTLDDLGVERVPVYFFSLSASSRAMIFMPQAESTDGSAATRSPEAKGSS